MLEDELTDVLRAARLDAKQRRAVASWGAQARRAWTTSGLHTLLPALPSLPFATELKTVMQSPELPIALIAVVDSRVTAPRARSLQAGLLKMGHESGSAGSLGPLRLRGFVLPKLPPHSAAP